MHNKEYISSKQYTSLLTGFIIGTSIILSFGLDLAKRDAWICEVLGSTMGLFILLTSAYIIRKFPDYSFEEIIETLVGKLFAKICMFFILCFSCILCGFVVNNISLFMNIMIMQNTPTWFFALSIALLTAHILRNGVEILARLAELFVPVIVFTLLFLAVLLIVGKFDVNNLKPQFTSKLIDIVRPSIVISIFPYGESILMLFLGTITKGSKDEISRGLKGWFIATFLLTLGTVLCIGVLSSYYASILTYPAFYVISSINFGDFFTRIEILILGAWFLAVFIKLSISLYSASRSLQYLLNSDSYNNLILPISLFIVPLSLKSYETYWDLISFNYRGLFVSFIPLLIVYLVILFRAIFYPKEKKPQVD